MKRITVWTIKFILIVLFLTVGSSYGVVENRANAQRLSPPNSTENQDEFLPDDGIDGIPPGKDVPEKTVQNYGPTARVAPENFDGPDEYGYIWDDDEPFNWIGAASGTDTGISQSNHTEGPFDLGFQFKYYEHEYDRLWISRYGHLSFTSSWLGDSSGLLPGETSPNNVVSPYWAYLNMDNSSKVYYRSGGSAPNRFFIAQWDKIHDGFSDNTFTFEVVLWEDGDIVMHYHTMDYGSNSRYCAGVGIENLEGYDGLLYSSCPKFNDRTAIRFHRPASAARAKIWPRHDGQFTSTGRNNIFEFAIDNTGERGTDIYNLASSSFWPVTLLRQDGVTPLTDTNGDGVIDTGSVTQGSRVTIKAKVITPNEAKMGDQNTVTVTARSSLNPTYQQQMHLQTTVPAPFAQAYRTSGDAIWGMSVYLAHPESQKSVDATESYHGSSALAIAETPNHQLIYAWSQNRGLGDDVYVDEVEYTVLDNEGQIVRPVQRLNDNSNAEDNTYMQSPALDVSPNGSTGIFWEQRVQRVRDGYWQYKSNLYFAVLDADGDVAVPARNITNNNDWLIYNPVSYGVPLFYDPHIAATGDNRFVLAWHRNHEERSSSSCSNYCWVSDIWYAVYDHQGHKIKGATKFTNDSPGGGDDDSYGDPTITGINGNRALLAFSRYYRQGDIHFAVIDSAGSVVKSMTNLVGDGIYRRDYAPDAVQLDSGNILVGWYGGRSPNYVIRYAVLDNSYNRIGYPADLAHPGAGTGNAYVSVTKDAQGNGILTWKDDDISRNLYYALVDGQGRVQTEPAIFYQGVTYTSRYGHGNTTYSAPEPTPTPTFTPTFTPTPTSTLTPTPTSTPTPTPSPTPTSTSTPTVTPTSTPNVPWAQWEDGNSAIVVAAPYTIVSLLYGNLNMPFTLVAELAGPAQFDNGESTLDDVVDDSGIYTFHLHPTDGAIPGEEILLSVSVGGADIQRSGVIGIPLFLPMLYQGQ